MRKKKGTPGAVVRRITVDEKLPGGDIRILIAALAPGVEAFFDRGIDWGEEVEVRVTPATYAQQLGLPDPAGRPWESLAEGQVFCSGEFEIVGQREAPMWLQVCPGRREFLRLDTLAEFKEGLKWLYSRALTGG